MKKQIAVLMAAATAVTTVAPVLANAEVKEHNNVATSEVNKQIKDALAEKYADKKHDGFENNLTDEQMKPENAYLNSRYAVFISANDKTITALGGYDEYIGKDKAVLEIANAGTYNGKVFEGVDTGKASVVIDANKASKLIEKLNAKDVDIKVYIVDKGIDKDTKLATFESKNKICATGVDGPETADKVTFGQMDAIVNKPENKFIKDDLLDGNITYDTGNKDTAKKAEFKLKSGEKITLEAEKDEALDFFKGYDKDGKEYNLSTVNKDILKTIVKLATIDRDDEGSTILDIKSGDTNVYMLKDIETSVIDVPTVYSSENGYTEKGAEFMNKLIKAKKAPFTFNHEGVNYVLKTPNATDIDTANAKIEKDGDKFVLRINVDVKNANDTSITKKLQFKIEGKNQKDLERVLDDLKKDKIIVAGKFTKLAGSNRYATAIEISKETFKDGEADTVVVVGGNAVIDGLSAGPLAAVKKAPILLADAKSGLNNDTLDEITRACIDKANHKDLKNKTVYIVGGESSVPMSVEKQLKEKFGAAVVRVSGKDRFETSLEVARRLKYDGKLNNEKAYIVGKEGAPDAMSIAGVAATSNDPGAVVLERVNPVIVVPKDDVSRKTRDFIEAQGFVKKYIIGGEGTVSTNVFKLLKADKRVSGKNRYETNVEILKEFYGEGKIKVDGAIFVSGKTDYLVDAQTSAVLSGNKKAPIVLTDNKLTDSQVDLLNKKKKGLLSGVKENVYQVGGVVSADVMKVVVDKLGL